MSDTLKVTVQMGNGAPSAQTFDFNSDDAAPLPPIGQGDEEIDTGSAPPSPFVGENYASAGDISASDAPSPPEFNEYASDGEEGSGDDGSAPLPPEA